MPLPQSPHSESPREPIGFKQNDVLVHRDEPKRDQTLIVQNEAETRSAENPDGVLAALETVDQDARLAEITDWLEKSRPECLPLDQAAQICWQIEQEEHDASFDDFLVTDEPPEDIALMVMDELKDQSLKSQTNQVEVQIVSDVPVKISTVAGKQNHLMEANTIFQTEADSLETDRIEATQRNADTKAELVTLQIEFDNLRSEKGSLAALKEIHLLALSPEIKAQIATVIHMAMALQGAVPEKSELVNRLIDQSGITIEAVNMAASFSGFMTAVENSDEIKIPAASGRGIHCAKT